MVAEPHSSQSEVEAWQHAEKLRIAAQYPGEDEDLTEAILDTPWRDTLESDMRKVYEQHLERTSEMRAKGYYTFPSDDLFWLNVELLLPGFERFLSRTARETPEGKRFMQHVAETYPPAVGVFEHIDKKGMPR